MRKNIFTLIGSLVTGLIVVAQSAGDYRSISNGNWNNATNWEIFNGNDWVNSNDYPGQHPGARLITIMMGTEINITETITHPIMNLYIPSVYEEIPLAFLNFSAETSVSLTVSEHVSIFGLLGINNQNGSKTHNLFIGGSLEVWRGMGTINGDDKLHVTFNSSGWNSISGVGIASFCDITFNSAGITIEVPISISGTATFINGIVYPVNYIGVEFLDNAIALNASNSSFVEGWVIKTGNDAFTFPIGSESVYSPLTVSAPQLATDDLAAFYQRGSNDGTILDPGLYSISECEYWIIQPYRTNFSGPVDVTVGWTSASGCGNLPYINNAADVTLAFSGDFGWNNHGGMGSGNSTNGTVTCTGLTDFGVFTLGNLSVCGTPSQLPVTNITANTATLNWSVFPGVTNYDVAYRSVGGSWINAATATTGTSINITGLYPSMVYDWRIRANCGSTLSLYRQAQFTTSACGTPTGLTTTNITIASATLNWVATPDAISYTIQYQQAGANSWNTLASATTGLSYGLFGLSASTGYNWRVRGNCSNGTGNYAPGYFITLPACLEAYETNNTSSQAKVIQLGAVNLAGITTASDVDWFKVTTPNYPNSNLVVNLSNLPADFDLYLYNHNNVLLGSSLQAGTTNESVFYAFNKRKATYYIKVIGKNGAFSNSQCYELQVLPNINQGNVPLITEPVNESTVKDGLLVYPNPATESVTLQFISEREELVSIQMHNSSGQIVKQVSLKLNRGSNQVLMSLELINPGIYFLRINKGELYTTRKLVISK